MKHHPYTVIITWSEEDKAFLACVPELPGCMADGNSREDAAKNIEAIIQEWIETANSLKRTVPKPWDHAAHEKMAKQFQEKLREHIQKEVSEAVQRVVSEMQQSMTAGFSRDSADWWKKC